MAKYEQHKRQHLPHPTKSYRESPLDDMDRRSMVFRRLAGHIEQIYADLGGVENLSFNERAIIEQIAFYREWIGQQIQAWLEGRSDEFELDTVLRVSNTMKTLIGQVGLQRRAKELGNVLDEFTSE